MFCALRKKKRGPASLLCGMCVRVFSFIARCTLHVSFASGVGVRAASYGVVLPPRIQESVLQDVIVGLNPVRNWCVAFSICICVTRITESAADLYVQCEF